MLKTETGILVRSILRHSRRANPIVRLQTCEKIERKNTNNEAMEI